MIQVPLFAIALVVMTVIPIIFAYLFVRHYINKDRGYWGSVITCSLAITLVLLSLLLIPLDVFTVSSSLNSIGEQTDPSTVDKLSSTMKIIYYIVYLVIVFFGFLVMPFLYFYFEEGEDEETSTTLRVVRALKFTIGFVIIFCVCIVLGFIFKKSGSGDGSDWKKRIISDMSDYEAFITFTLSILAIFGLVFYVIYGSYGLATIPVTMIRSRQSTLEEDKAALLLENDELTARQKINQDKFEFQSAGKPVGREGSKTAEMAQKYGYTGRRGMSLAEREHTRETRKDLLDTERKLKSNQEKINHLNNMSSRCIHIWNLLGPLRIILGIILLLLSFLIIVQMSISVIDRIVHSSCKWSCGFAIDKSSYVNPIDDFLVIISNYFPLDLIFFSVTTIYLFVACIVGMAALGVRLVFIKMFTIRADATPVNAMLLGCWLLMFCGLVLNQQIYSISPRYASFGDQFYMKTVKSIDNFSTSPLSTVSDVISSPIHNLAATLASQSNTNTEVQYDMDTTEPFLTQDLAEFDLSTNKTVKTSCTLDESNLKKTCKLTKVSEFILKTNANFPAFGVIQFFANVAFLVFFVIFFIYGFIKSNKTTGYVQSDDPNMPNYVHSF